MTGKTTSPSFFDDHECRLCDRPCRNRRALGNHLARSHPAWPMERYVLQHLHNGTTPLCECGCGGEVKWHRQLYHFNRFLSGHNNAWSSSNQPGLSAEGLDRRSDSIRRTYEKRGEEIKERISISVTEALSSPEWRAAQSQRTSTLWEDPGFRERVSASQRRSWRENYEARCEAVFTDETRRKLSLANAARDLKRKSAQEEEVLSHLARLLPVPIDPDRWVQCEEGTKCFDAWVPDWGLLIELDGPYWHGLDRAEGFTLGAVSGMANDFQKNRVALDLGHSLARIPLTDAVIQGLREASSLDRDALLSLAHHIQEPSRIVKDGMFRFASDDTPLIRRDTLIRWNEPNLGGKGKEETERRALPVVVRFFREYLLSRGWLYPTHEGGAAEAVEAVRAAREHRVTEGVIEGNPRAGNDFLKSRMTSYWHAAEGPAVACTDPKRLERVLAYRMGLNGSQPYTYELESGETVTTRETFDLSPRTVRNGFVVQRASVSWFSPVLARDLWRLALEGCSVADPVVWDPSAGFGARMLGFAAAYPGGAYVATEPASHTFSDLERLRDELLGAGVLRGGAFLERTGSERVELPEGFLDAVMTSPPYFDLERYFDEPGQCWRDYPDFDSWRDLYLLPTLRTAHRSLKGGGRAVINVSQRLADAVLAAAVEAGFTHERTLTLARHRDHFSRKKGTTAALGEPVIFLRRP